MTVLVACNKEVPTVETSEVVETSEIVNETTVETTTEAATNPLDELISEMTSIYTGTNGSEPTAIANFETMHASGDGIIDRRGFETDSVYVAIYEVDPQSNTYAALTPNGELTFHRDAIQDLGLPATDLTEVITAVNGQYVLCVAENDGNGNYNTNAPFNDAALQAVYDAFMAY